MKFTNDYFKDEIREGFYIPGMVKKSWATQIDVMQAVAKVCEKHDIKWFAAYGTLLGAIRHHGYIPWDDDLDICMLQDDYLRFIEIAPRELGGGHEVLNLYTNEEYDNFLTRIVNQHVINTEKEFMDKHYGFPYASGIDVFPLNYLYKDEKKEENRRLAAGTVWRLLQENNDQVKEARWLIKQVEDASGYKVRKDRPLPNALNLVLDKLFFEAKEKGDFVTLMPIWSTSKGQKMPIEWFDDIIEVPFETGVINVPAAYEKILRNVYGNWEKANHIGGLHDYPFYEKMEKELEKRSQGGKIAYKYYYEKNADKQEDPDVITGIYNMIINADMMLEKLAGAGDYNSVLSLLESCQELAIKVGTQLEEIYGEDSSQAVKELEEYCENLYYIGEGISSSDHASVKDLIGNLNNYIKASFDKYLNELRNTEDVLFIVRKASEWQFIKPLYSEKKKAGEKVLVLISPFYEKDSQGNIIASDFFDSFDFPDDIETVNYNEYSFSRNHPREIIIQTPFDQFESGLSIHPFFYSSNLKKYTDKLTYVQSFDIDEIEDGDEKGLHNIKAIIISPGVVNADKVYVQSDRMRKLFIKILSETTEEPAETLEENVLIRPSATDENKSKETGNEKKKILFYTSFASFYENPLRIISKMDNVFESFKNNSDKVSVVWAVDGNTPSLLEEKKPELFEKYNEARKKYDGLGIGSFLIIDDAEKTVEECDAFYGSGGYVMNLAVRKKIPVMIWDI